MPVADLNHINIKAPMSLLDNVRDFYINAVGLNNGSRPDIPIQGYWLYAGDKPIVHLMEVADLDGTVLNGKSTTGHLDHVAFTCTDISATEEHLDSLGIEYRRNDFHQYGFSQLFMKDPTGLGVELNFPHNAQGAME